jgi:hypothetical protein
LLTKRLERAGAPVVEGDLKAAPNEVSGGGEAAVAGPKD